MELRTKQIDLVWSGDLSDFITEKFGRRFNVLDDGEYSQNELVVFDVGKDDEATERVQRWLDSPEPEKSWVFEADRPLTSDVLNELANRGELPEKELHVNIWW